MARGSQVDTCSPHKSRSPGKKGPHRGVWRSGEARRRGRLHRALRDAEEVAGREHSGEGRSGRRGGLEVWEPRLLRAAQGSDGMERRVTAGTTGWQEGAAEPDCEELLGVLRGGLSLALGTQGP